MSHPDLIAQTIFCESARLEVRGQTSLVGIFPDNVAFNPNPNPGQSADGQRPQIPMFCLYTRIRMPLSREVKSDIQLRFTSPSGQQILDVVIEKDFIERSIEDAKGQDNEYVLVMQHAEIVGFPIMESGRYRAIVTYGGEEYFSGAIRFTEAPPTPAQ